MRPLVIYHGNCADGFAAAWCFWTLLEQGEPHDFHAGVYGEPPPDVTDRWVILVDFSYPREVILKMAETARIITIIDHHKSAIQNLYGVSKEAAELGLCHISETFDINHSGAMLAWQYVYTGVPAPQLLRHVEDRDLWRFELPGTREIQAALFSYPYDFEVWDRLMKTPVDRLLADGAAIERKHHKDAAELVKVCQRRLTIAGHRVPVASLPYTLSSDAGHLMAQGEPFAASYWDTETGRVFSLRSAPDGLDVSEIARQYGGGGHQHAAGFTVPRDHELAKA